MGSERRRVGLVVLNWNGAEVLPSCLESLEGAAARSRHATSLLLVDNASTDGSDAWAEANRPAWTLLRTGENLGFAAGMNRGLSRLLHEEHDYLCILNNDVEADPDLIDPLVDDLEAEARRGAVSPRIHYHGRRDEIWYGGGKVGKVTRVSRHLGIRRSAEGRWLQPADTGYLTGCCLLGRAEFWRSTGGFDESFGMYAEDVDLSLRARALGWTLRYQPAALLYHRVGFASGGGLSAGKLRAQRRATALLLRRHVRPALRPVARLGWLAFWLRGLGAAILRGEGSAIGAALASLGPGERRGERAGGGR